MNRQDRRDIKFGRAFSEDRIWHQPPDLNCFVGVQADIEYSYSEWIEEINTLGIFSGDHPQNSLWITQISIL